MKEYRHIKYRRIRVWAIILIILLISISRSSSAPTRQFLGFKPGKESSRLPEGWEVITYFRTNENRISLTKEGARTILKMKSLGSASAVLKRIQVDPKAFPWLVWCWKIDRVVGMAIESRKERNDSSARIRVIFEKKAGKPFRSYPRILKFLSNLNLPISGSEPSGFKIDYIWGNDIPRGKVIDYPDSENHKIVIVKNGNKKANQWVWEKRNLIKDFQKFFGEQPLNLIGIVVLTDTDQTNEGVTAHYSSIVLTNQ